MESTGIQLNITMLAMCIIKITGMTATYLDVTIYTNEALEIEDFTNHVRHPREENYLERHEFRKQIYELCETTFQPLTQIFNDVALRYVSLSLSLYLFEQYNLPIIPSSFLSLLTAKKIGNNASTAEHLKNYPYLLQK